METLTRTLTTRHLRTKRIVMPGGFQDQLQVVTECSQKIPYTVKHEVVGGGIKIKLRLAQDSVANPYTIQ